MRILLIQKFFLLINILLCPLRILVLCNRWYIICGTRERSRFVVIITIVCVITICIVSLWFHYFVAVCVETILWRSFHRDLFMVLLGSQIMIIMIQIILLLIINIRYLVTVLVSIGVSFWIGPWIKVILVCGEIALENKVVLILVNLVFHVY